MVDRAIPRRVGTLIGTVLHYYPRVSVAVVSLSGEIAIGDTVRVRSPMDKRRGAKVDFYQRVRSIQIEHEAVERAAAGRLVALNTDHRVYPGDKVYAEAPILGHPDVLK